MNLSKKEKQNSHKGELSSWDPTPLKPVLDGNIKWEKRGYHGSLSESGEQCSWEQSEVGWIAPDHWQRGELSSGWPLCFSDLLLQPQYLSLGFGEPVEAAFVLRTEKWKMSKNTLGKSDLQRNS